MNDFIPEVAVVNPEIICLDSILDRTICGGCNHTHINCTCGRFSVKSNKENILKKNNSYSNNPVIYNNQLFLLGYDFEDCKFNGYHFYDRWIDATCIINHGEINLCLSEDKFDNLNETLKNVCVSALNLDLKYVIQVDLKEFIEDSNGEV